MEEETEIDAQNNDPMEIHDSTAAPSVEDKIRVLRESNESDFDAWTSLIAETEQSSPNNINQIHLVYDSFLSQFPLCFGYWTKYSNHVARLCTLSEAGKIYEQAVCAAPYSVDLWANYCSFGILSYEDPADIRRLFTRALSFIGRDYLCNLLWDKYIEFEYSQEQWSCLALVFIDTLKFPTKKLHIYYDRLKKFTTFLEEEMRCSYNRETPPETAATSEMDVKACEYAETSTVIRDLLYGKDGDYRVDMLKKYLSIGEKLYNRSSELDGKISLFEVRIRRPYFHVSALDRSQLENWHQYLDFVEMQGDFDWAVKLYERCLISCANYPEFWIRFVEFVNLRGGREIANYAVHRALDVFLKNVPAFRHYCAMFKEQAGDSPGARASFLKNDMNSNDDFIQNVKREANMEKRLGNKETACFIYEKAIMMALVKQDSYMLSILYYEFALFKFVITGSVDAATEVLIKGIQQAPCKSLLEGLVHFAKMHGGAEQIPKIDDVISNMIIQNSDTSRGLTSSDCEEVSRLFLEFVDLHGSIEENRKVWARHIRTFRHITYPDTNCSSIVDIKDILNKNMDMKNQLPVALPDQDSVTAQKKTDMQVVARSPIQNNVMALSDDARTCALIECKNENAPKKLVEANQEEYKVVSDSQKETIIEELHAEVNELTNGDYSMLNTKELTTCSEEKDRELHNPDHELDSDIKPVLSHDIPNDLPERQHSDNELDKWSPSCDAPLSYSPDNPISKSKSSSNGSCNAQNTTNGSVSDEIQLVDDITEASVHDVKSKTCTRPVLPSETNLEESIVFPSCGTTTIMLDVREITEFRGQSEVQADSKNEPHHNDGDSGNKTHTSHVGQDPQDPNTEGLKDGQILLSQQLLVPAQTGLSLDSLKESDSQKELSVSGSLSHHNKVGSINQSYGMQDQVSTTKAPGDVQVSQLQMDLIPAQAELHSDSKRNLPVGVSLPLNNKVAESPAMSYVQQGSQNTNTKLHGDAHSFQSQKLLVPQHSQSLLTSSRPFMDSTQYFQCQPQSWENSQHDQARQTQNQYQMSSGQVYSNSNIAWPVQSIQHQVFGCAITQQGNQLASQPQSQVYQLIHQNNGQHGHIQSSQGYPQQIWQYYQQHLIYLQQQLLQNQQNLHQLQHQQQQLYQQENQYSSLCSQQSQQVHTQQVQQQLLYLQQQHHMIQQQQQQLMVFQQQQQLLYHHHHQQQQQQQQQLVLQQQHQPSVLLQQQQESQQHNYQLLIQQHHVLFQQQQQQQQQLLQQQQHLLQQQQHVLHPQQQQQWQEQLARHQKQEMTVLDQTASFTSNFLQCEGPKKEAIQQPESSGLAIQQEVSLTK